MYKYYRAKFKKSKWYGYIRVAPKLKIAHYICLIDCDGRETNPPYYADAVSPDVWKEEEWSRKVEVSSADWELMYNLSEKPGLK